MTVINTGLVICQVFYARIKLMSKSNLFQLAGISLFIFTTAAQAAKELKATIEYAGTAESVAPMSIKVKSESGERDCRLPCVVGAEDAFTNTLIESVVVKIPVSGGKDAEVLLDPKSSVKMEKTDTGLVPVLDVGTTHVSVPKADSKKDGFRFFIRTQTATMGVRGTEFVVEHSESGNTTVNTLDGEVGMAKNLDEFKEEKGKAPRWNKVEGGMQGSWMKGDSNIKEVRQFNRESFLKHYAEKHPHLARAAERRVERRMERRQERREERREQRRETRQENRQEHRQEMRNGNSQNNYQPSRPTQQGDFDKLLRGKRSDGVNPTALPPAGRRR